MEDGPAHSGLPSEIVYGQRLRSTVFYFMTGALAARLLGLLVDGTVAKQWLWVAVETVAMALAALWLWRSGGSAP